jgi:hypothetical protein
MEIQLDKMSMRKLEFVLAAQKRLDNGPTIKGVFIENGKVVVTNGQRLHSVQIAEFENFELGVYDVKIQKGSLNVAVEHSDSRFPDFSKQLSEKQEIDFSLDLQFLVDFCRHAKANEAKTVNFSFSEGWKVELFAKDKSSENSNLYGLLAAKIPDPDDKIWRP